MLVKTKYIFLALVLILFDQGVKLLASKAGFVQLNDRYILGLFSIPNPIFFILFALFIFYLITKILQTPNNIKCMLYTFVLAGALSNALDRGFKGYVVDYLNLFNVTYVNIADLFIFFGVLLVIVIEFKNLKLH